MFVLVCLTINTSIKISLKFNAYELLIFLNEVKNHEGVAFVSSMCPLVLLATVKGI